MRRSKASGAGPIRPGSSNSRESTDDADERLDPVRWRRPGRGTLIRMAAIAALLTTAAVISWSPPSCRPPVGVAAVSPSTSTAATPLKSAPAGAAPPIPAGSIGVPVRLADPTALTVVHPGNRVDLLRLNDSTGETTAVATAALVVTVSGASDPATGGLLLALSPAEARLAVSTPNRGFAILIRPG